MGQILARCGGSEFFTDLARAWMGRYRGGAAKIAVVGSALFGMISGSAVANVSAVGVVSIPLMKRSGFPPTLAAAVEAVGSTGGQLMPPVMGAAAFLMAEVLQVPYSAVLVAAIIPALLYYLALFFQVDLEAAKRGIVGEPRERLPRAREVLRAGWYFPIPFGVLLYALLVMNTRAEYAALLAAGVLIACALVFGFRGHRYTVSEVLRAVVSTGGGVIDLVLICAAAGMFIGILNITGFAFGLTLHVDGDSARGARRLRRGEHRRNRPEPHRLDRRAHRLERLHRAVPVRVLADAAHEGGAAAHRLERPHRGARHLDGHDRRGRILPRADRRRGARAVRRGGRAAAHPG
jgi:TRAP transporter 4TM/12TM fusion protein